jgi:hypothetical protein
MAKYESRFKTLAFYVGGERKQFIDGKYSTNKSSEIDVLGKLTDAIRIDKPEQPKAEEAAPTPAPKKAPVKRKPSAK